MPDRYYLTRSTAGDGYELVVREVDAHDPTLIPVLTDLDLLSFFEPTFSRFTLGAILRYGRVYTISANDLVIGACHCIRSYEDPEEIVIFNMALRPGWRGNGLGTRLLHGVLTRLKAHGTRSVALLVAATNHRAIAVYRTKFGFAHVTTFANEYNNGVEYLLMRLDLAGEIPQPFPEQVPIREGND